MHMASKLLWSYVEDDRAATSIEYGLIAVSMSIAIATVVLQIGASVQILLGQAAAAF